MEQGGREPENGDGKWIMHTGLHCPLSKGAWGMEHMASDSIPRIAGDSKKESNIFTVKDTIDGSCFCLY